MRYLLPLGLISTTLGALACDGASETAAGPGSGASTSQSTSSSTSAQSSGGSAGQSSGGSGGAAGSPGCGMPERPGASTETIDVNGTERSFVLVVPESVDGMTPVPLIFGFHGFNGTGEAASQYFELTGGEAAVYAYPQALPLPGQNGGVGWDMEPDGDDVAFFDALVTALGAAHCIDLTRVFSAGHSHGASFSNHLGCYRPDALRAIAPVAGGGPWAGPCTGSVSAMLTHGSADMDVPISN